MMPSVPGFSRTAFSISRARSNPGRCQGTQTMLWPKSRLNSSSLFLPLALAASAIAQSGCRWSTWGNGKKACKGVSMDARSEEHTSELQSRRDLVCRLLLEKKKKKKKKKVRMKKE